MKKLFKNTFGFGLVEVLIAAGLAGGLALTIAKLSQNAGRVTKTTESNNEINMMMNDVAYILSDKGNCLATIPPMTPANGANIPSINRNAGGTAVPVFKADGTKYGNGTFTISSMNTERIGVTDDVRLVLNITRLNSVVNGAKSITKRIPLKVVLTGANIDSCYSDTENIITTAARAACHGNSARWDATNSECHHDIEFVGVTGNPLVCPIYTTPKQVDTTDGVATFTCAPIFDSSCGTGSFINGWDADGEPRCNPIVSNNCGLGQYTRTLSTGALVCVDIPKCGVQGVLRSDATSGELICQTVPCNSVNQYFAGFNSMGSPVCKNFPDSSCGAGQYIKEVRPNGTVVCDTVPNPAQGVVASNEYLRGYAADGTKIAGTIDVCSGTNQFSYFDGTHFACGSATGLWQLISNKLTYTPTSSPTKPVRIDYDGKILGSNGLDLADGDVNASKGYFRGAGASITGPYTEARIRITNTSGEQDAQSFIEFRVDNPNGGGSLEVGVSRPNGSAVYRENNAGYLNGNLFMPSIASNKPLVPTPTHYYASGFVYPGLGKSTYRWANIFLSSFPNVSSDRRLKKEIKDLDLGLSFIESLKPVSFKLKNDNKMGNKTKYGLIAQDVEKSLDEAGVSKLTTEIVTKDDNGFLGMSYEALISPIIKAIQELSDKVDSLFNQQDKAIKDLELRMNQLEKENRMLKQELRATKKKK